MLMNGGSNSAHSLQNNGHIHANTYAHGINNPNPNPNPNPNLNDVGGGGDLIIIHKM